jgi:predicted heme/steroid binding protein
MSELEMLLAAIEARPVDEFGNQQSFYAGTIGYLTPEVVKAITGIDAFLVWEDHRYGGGVGAAFVADEPEAYDFSSVMSDGGNYPCMFAAGINEDQHINCVLTHANPIAKLLTKYRRAPLGIHISVAEAVEAVNKYSSCDWEFKWCKEIDAKVRRMMEIQEIEASTGLANAEPRIGGRL